MKHSNTPIKMSPELKAAAESQASKEGYYLSDWICKAVRAALIEVSINEHQRETDGNS